MSPRAIWIAVGAAWTVVCTFRALGLAIGYEPRWWPRFPKQSGSWAAVAITAALIVWGFVVEAWRV
jgi:hypothetical protein